MHKLFVILSLWCFSILLSSGAYAAKSREITLPSYNPVRYRVPATPAAQALHQKIIKVSTDLATLKAVQLDDPSIDQRFAAMIQAKIKGITRKLDTLKQDMKQRQKRHQKKLQKQGARQQEMRTQIATRTKAGSGHLVNAAPSSASALNPQEKAEQTDSTSAEIKALKISLQGIIKKLEVLEKRTQKRRKTKPLEQKVAHNGAASALYQPALKRPTTIPLPVAKQLAFLAPTLVRTKIIYPSQGQGAATASAAANKPNAAVKRARKARMQQGVFLPSARPLLSQFQNRRSKTQFWQPQKMRKRRRKRYASVEDRAGKSSAWSEIAVLKATNQCLKLFRNLNIDYVEKPSIKNGRCGTAAPIHFKGFGTRHSVSISPPATLNCKATAVIAHWMNKKVQPLAMRLLGSPIAKIHNISSYNCRNRYGRKNGRISEHAYANALDIMAFTTQKGEKIDLLKHFYADNEKGQFLRTVHKLACKDKFGTVLGPEANAAHKNHFHLDLAKRRRSAYCE